MGRVSGVRSRNGPSRLQVGVAGRALEGQTKCGDAHLVRPLRSTTLVEIIDGLGHGGPAAAAARTALEVLETAPATGTVTSLFEGCHRALAGTPGVAMSLASVDAAAATLSSL